jgi:hypothetical protein
MGQLVPLYSPVTRKQYHFIIHTDFRTDLKPELRGKRICQLCTAALPEKEKVCTACGENDSETSILDYQTHLMHGGAAYALNPLVTHCLESAW